MASSSHNLPQTASEDDKKPTVGFDLSDPRSVPNLLPDAWKKAISSLDERWFTYHERHLRKRCKPDRVDNVLRNRFWAEYQRAHDTGGVMSVSAIMAGVTYDDYLRKVILAKPAKLAWIVRPPVAMVFTQEEALQEGIYQLREALSRYDDPDFLYITTTKEYAGSKGKAAWKQVTRKVNTPVLAELRKIVESLSVRVQGAITQQVQIAQRVHQINQDLPHPGAPEQKGLSSDLGALEEMQTNLTKLNSRLAQVQDTVEVIDVNPTEEGMPPVPEEF